MSSNQSLYGVNIRREVAERLRRYCARTDRKIGATVERAVVEYLARAEQAEADQAEQK